MGGFSQLVGEARDSVERELTTPVFERHWNDGGALVREDVITRAEEALRG